MSSRKSVIRCLVILLEDVSQVDLTRLHALNRTRSTMVTTSVDSARICYGRSTRGIFGYKLAANVSSVISMRVDCMTAFENELTGLQQKVKLFKPRAGDISEYVVQ
jgi:hypothetical protein